MKTKYCPILEGKITRKECKLDKCAWWDHNMEKCAVVSIARNLDLVRATIEWVGRGVISK